MIAEKGGKLIRVQVKTMNGDTPALRFFAQNSAARAYVGTADWLAFHSLHHGVTAFLKPEEAGVYPTLRYDGADEARMSNQRYAIDYPIDRVIKEIET